MTQSVKIANELTIKKKFSHREHRGHREMNDKQC
jgi:hypothetical protein